MRKAFCLKLKKGLPKPREWQALEEAGNAYLPPRGITRRSAATAPEPGKHYCTPNGPICLLCCRFPKHGEGRETHVQHPIPPCSGLLHPSTPAHGQSAGANLAVRVNREGEKRAELGARRAGAQRDGSKETCGSRWEGPLWG